MDQAANAFSSALDAVSDDAADRYAARMSLLIAQVNDQMERRPDLGNMLGGLSPELMRENHENHARFMESVFRLKSGSVAVNTVAWVYRTYIARGFTPEYFREELNAWKEAVNLIMGEHSETIAQVYDLMLDRHASFLEWAQERDPYEAPAEAELPLVRQFVDALLAPSVVDAVELARTHITSVDHIRVWWNQIIRPAMYEVGRLWEGGRITAAQEHLATAITQRVMSIFYPMILGQPRTRGKLVFAASPGELHELGPRIVADLLEIQGWDVYFTGANTPVEDLVGMVRDLKAPFLCLSTTLSFNLTQVKSVIDRVKASGLDPVPRVIVGGQAYYSDPMLWRRLGADAEARTPDQALAILNAPQSLS
jgi:methanogenic corrinoid protein MtbC1